MFGGLSHILIRTLTATVELELEVTRPQLLGVTIRVSETRLVILQHCLICYM